jgi:hypothetical protein
MYEMDYEKGSDGMNLDIDESRPERSSEEQELKLLISQISQGDEDAMRIFIIRQ